MSDPNYWTRLAAEVELDGEQQGYELLESNDGKERKQELFREGDSIQDRYDVIAVHRGGMGIVYGCLDRTLMLPRALKTLQLRLIADAHLRALFENEAAVWVKLGKHPCIVRAYRVDIIENLPFVVTEYVLGQEGKGSDLTSWVGTPELTKEMSVRVGLNIAQGMLHAVQQIPGLVHRDLKPANVLVNSEGRAMVADFGLSAASSASAGTPAYMAPEQWRADLLDQSTDIYAFGCIMFEMLTSRRLFNAKSVGTWREKHLHHPAPRLQSIIPDIPGEIDFLLHRCLEKTPSKRPASWKEIIECLTSSSFIRAIDRLQDTSASALQAMELNDAAYSLFNLKRFKEALAVADQLIELEPKSSFAWSRRAAPLMGMRDFDGALKACERALSLDSNNFDALTTKAGVLHEIRRYKDALQATTEGLRARPRHIGLLINRSLVLYHLGRFEEALPVADAAIQIVPNSTDAWNSKANILFKLGRLSEAAEAYSRQVRLDPVDFVAWYNLGFISQKIGRTDAAIAAYDHALKLDPASEVALSARASVTSSQTKQQARKDWFGWIK